MAFEIPKEKWASSVSTVILGATEAEGGTRTNTVTVGGESTLPFLHFEGDSPNRPVIAMEVLDPAPEELPPVLAEHFGEVLGDPAAWAQKCVEQYGADLICLRFVGLDPDDPDPSPDYAGEQVQAVLKAVGVPLIIWGTGLHEKDNNLIPVCSQAASGENCLLATAVEDNYKTIAASCIADSHKVLTEAPLDINIQKQVNILVSEMGVGLDQIVMFQSTGGLGYGMEYAFSILERTRLAALGGDAMLSMPMLSVVGSEAWKAKEAKLPEEEAPGWGNAAQRGPLWEAITATSFLHAGTDILVMWHPEAVAWVRATIDQLMEAPASA